MAQFSRNYLAAGGTASLSDYYATAYDGAVFNRQLRRNVVFADHSLATDTVFSEVHLVSCRNVLIYFNRDLQDRAVGLFRDALVHRGLAWAARSRCSSGATTVRSRLLARASPTGKSPDEPADTTGRAGDRGLCGWGRSAADGAWRAACGTRAGAGSAAPATRSQQPHRRSAGAVLRAAGARGRDKQPLQPGTVTFAPPDYHLLVEDAGSLALSVDAPVLFSRPAIDPLFESAAAVFARRCWPCC